MVTLFTPWLTGSHLEVRGPQLPGTVSFSTAFRTPLIWLPRLWTVGCILRRGQRWQERCNAAGQCWEAMSSLGEQGWRIKTGRPQLTLGPQLTVPGNVNIFSPVMSQSAFLGEKLLEAIDFGAPSLLSPLRSGWTKISFRWEPLASFYVSSPMS